GYARAPESDCSTRCNANPSQVCGGGWRNSVYETGAASPPPPPPPPPPPASGRIKLVSWNTLNAQDPSGQPAGLGPQSADAIFLQEVPSGTAPTYVNAMNAYERNVAHSGKTWAGQGDDAVVLTWRPLIGALEVKDIGQNSWPDNYDWTNNPHRSGVRATV